MPAVVAALKLVPELAVDVIRCVLSPTNQKAYMFTAGDPAVLGSAKAVMIATFFIPLIVGVWWLVFSIPLFLRVPEPPAIRTGVIIVKSPDFATAILTR